MPNISDRDLAAVNKALEKAVANEHTHRKSMEVVGQVVVNALAPALNSINQQIANLPEAIEQSVSRIKIDSPKIPDIALPNITIPPIKVTVPDIPKPEVTVNIPPIEVPQAKVTVNVPKNEAIVKKLDKMEKSFVKALLEHNTVEPQTIDFPDYTLKKPMPVIIADLKGNPWIPFTSEGKGGGAGILRFRDSGDKERIVSDEFPLPVDASLSITDTIDVRQVSGQVWSVVVNSFTGTIGASLQTDDGDTVMDEEYNAAQVSVVRITDFVQSVKIASQDAGYEVKQVSGLTDSVNINQLGGNNISTGNGDVESGTMRTIEAKSPNATTTAVTVGADSATLISPTQASRKSIAVVHNSTVNLYISTGAQVSASAFPIVANQAYVFDDYTGPVYAVLEEAGGTTAVRYIETV